MDNKTKFMQVRNYVILAMMSTSLFITSAEGFFAELYDKAVSAYNDISKVVIIAGLIAAAVCAICYFSAKDPRKADEAFTWGKRIILGLIVFIALPRIIMVIVENLGMKPTALNDLTDLVGTNPGN